MLKVTCFMPTFNRINHQSDCVHEAVECFLRQDYSFKELIILNDCPQQELVFNHRLVKVINLQERCPCFSDACNKCIRAGDGELITQWNDDDILLPWALSVRVQCVGLGWYLNPYVKTTPYFYSEGNEIRKVVRSHASQSAIFTRHLFEQLNGYRLPLNQEHDRDFDQRVVELLGSATEKVISDDLAHLIYRWGDGNYHMSGQMPKFDGDPSQYNAHGALPITPGKFNIEPRWKRDYISDAKAAMLTTSNKQETDQVS